MLIQLDIRSLTDSIWIRLKVCTVVIFSRVWLKGKFYTLEEYDAELERMNASMIAENQALQHDNKQLNALIKEYEQTLENLMS